MLRLRSLASIDRRICEGLWSSGMVFHQSYNKSLSCFREMRQQSAYTAKEQPNLSVARSKLSVLCTPRCARMSCNCRCFSRLIQVMAVRSTDGQSKHAKETKALSTRISQMHSVERALAVHRVAQERYCDQVNWTVGPAARDVISALNRSKKLNWLWNTYETNPRQKGREQISKNCLPT
jgi:hypothetical protein